MKSQKTPSGQEITFSFHWRVCKVSMITIIIGYLLMYIPFRLLIRLIWINKYLILNVLSRSNVLLLINSNQIYRKFHNIETKPVRYLIRWTPYLHNTQRKRFVDQSVRSGHQSYFFTVHRHNLTTKIKKKCYNTTKQNLLFILKRFQIIASSNQSYKNKLNSVKWASAI